MRDARETGCASPYLHAPQTGVAGTFNATALEQIHQGLKKLGGNATLHEELDGKVSWASLSNIKFGMQLLTDRGTNRESMLRSSRCGTLQSLHR